MQTRYRASALAAAAALGALATVTSAGPLTATADTVAGRPTGRLLVDSSADMFVMTADSPNTYRPAPGQSVDDVTTVAVAHQTARVVVTLHYTDLRRVGAGHNYQLKFRMADRLREAVLLTRPGHWRGRLLFGDSFDTTPCPGKASHVSYRHNVVRVGIPRGCLGDPAWVQVQQRNSWWREPSGTMYVDNAHNARPRPKTFTARVYHGLR